MNAVRLLIPGACEHPFAVDETRPRWIITTGLLDDDCTDRHLRIKLSDGTQAIYLFVSEQPKVGLTKWLWIRNEEVEGGQQGMVSPLEIRGDSEGDQRGG